MEPELSQRQMSNSNPELYSYASKVDLLAKSMSGEICGNAGPDHARIVVSKLLATCRKSLSMASAGLSGDVHTILDYKDLLGRVAPENVRVILGGNRAERNNELIDFLLSKGCQLRQAQNGSGHLIVADDHSFRFETDVVLRKAVFAFGGTRAGKFLAAFETKWSVSEALSHPS